MATAVLERKFDTTTTLTPVLQIHSPGTLVQKQGNFGKGSWPTFVSISFAVAVVGISVAFEPWKTGKSHSVQAATHSTEATPEAAKTVSVDRPSRGSNSSVVLPATFRPWQTTELHARVSGYLAAWNHDLGETVKAGELLAEIETPELDQELAEGKSLVREADAAVLQARAERVEAEADIQVAEAQLVRLQAEAKLTRVQILRREKLVPTGAVSREEYDTFVTQLETQTAQIAAAESDIARRRTNLETRAAIIEAKEAAVKSRRASVDRLQELQTFKRIVAPFAGTVTQRTAEVGMLVTAGKESLFTLQDMSRVRVQVNVPQTYSLQMVPGVEATITVPESAVKNVPGTITRISSSVDSTNRTMLAEIELANSKHRLQTGSYAQVTLTTSQDDSGWTIPTNTLSMRVAGAHVAVVNSDNQIEIKPVKLGRDLGHRVVVTDGIRGDERLVVNPGDDLTNGSRIQVRNNEQHRTVAKR